MRVVEPNSAPGLRVAGIRGGALSPEALVLRLPSHPRLRNCVHPDMVKELFEYKPVKKQYQDPDNH